MLYGSRIKKRVDKDQQQQNCNEDAQQADATVLPDKNDLPIDIRDLNESFLESLNVGGSADQYTSDSGAKNRLSASEVYDNTYREPSDIEANSVLRDSIEINDLLSDNILAAVGPDKAPPKSEKYKVAKNDPSPIQKRPWNFVDMSTDANVLQSKPTGGQSKPTGAKKVTDAAGENEKREPIRESARESAARKRAQMKLLAEESVAAKRAKAMSKFQDRGVPCVSDNCRSRGSFESEQQELDRLIAAEEKRDATLHQRPNKCIGFLHREFDKSAFKPSLYMNLYKEPVTVRRVRRKPAQPEAPKKQAKPNKTSDLRFKYLHNQKVVSSNAEEHLKKFKRPPFKNPTHYGHYCNDPPAHFAEEREQRKMDRLLKKTRESSQEMLAKKSAAK